MNHFFLYIIEADLSSGSGKCALELIKLLKSNTNYEPIVITQFHNNLNDACNTLNVKNYYVHYARTCSFGMGWLGWLIAFCCRPFLNYFSYHKLKKHIHFEKISLIHSNSSSIDFGAYLHKKLKIPHIWQIREFLVFKHYWKPIIYKLPQYIINNSTSIITVSKQLETFIKKNNTYANVKTIYDGVHKPIKLEPKKPNEGILKLVCVGNLAPLKGQDFLLKALALLPNNVSKNISIDFYGSFVGDFKNDLQKIIKDFSITLPIHFKGFHNDISKILPNYDIGVHPSHTEGFSRVTIEYMFAGLCIIGNGNTTIQEQISNQKTGLLYEDNVPQSLANQIIFCYQNREKMAEMGNQAQLDAINKYDIGKNFYNIIKEYNLTIH